MVPRRDVTSVAVEAQYRQVAAVDDGAGRPGGRVALTSPSSVPVPAGNRPSSQKPCNGPGYDDRS